VDNYVPKLKDEQTNFYDLGLYLSQKIVTRGAGGSIETAIDGENRVVAIKFTMKMAQIS